MGKRLKLQTILETILGSENVYFQPPATFKMKYPCIVYERYVGKTIFADNIPYSTDVCYQLTVIDRDPDSIILDKVAKLPKCVLNRHYTADNLNHDIYNLFY